MTDTVASPVSGDSLPVAIAKDRLEDDSNAYRQPGYFPQAVFFQCRQAVQLTGAETFLNGKRIGFCAHTL